MYEDFMSDEKMFEYNSSTNKLFILETPEKIEKLALKIHRSPESIEKVYENSWAQKYIAALCKIAWGQNIGKFAGGTLPGGVALDYNRIIQEGKEEKQELEEELYSRYSEPYDFFTA
jgi:hypothetical protein